MTATITIGLAAYNGDKIVGVTIESLLSQTFGDFEILISDDASSDGTEAVCRKWVSLDARVRYIKQKTNIGPLANFIYALKESKSKYFMWASHDDLWHPSFVNRCLSELESHKDCGFAITRWIVESRSLPFVRRIGLPEMNFVTNHDPIKRMLEFTSLPFTSFKDNMTYGVWRREALSKIVNDLNGITKYFSIGGAANEYALMLYRGCYVSDVYLRKRYKWLPPGHLFNPVFEYLSKLMRSHKKSLYPPYTPNDHLKDLAAVLEKAGVNSQIIDRAICLNKLHLGLS